MDQITTKNNKTKFEMVSISSLIFGKENLLLSVQQSSQIIQNKYLELCKDFKIITI